MVDKKHFDKAVEDTIRKHERKMFDEFLFEQKTSIPSDQEMLDNISEAASKIKSGSPTRTVQGDELFTQPGLSGVMPGWDKRIVSEKETAIGESQPCVLGNPCKDYVIGIDRSVTDNPPTASLPVETLEKENALDEAELAIATAIEDAIEDHLDEHYAKDQNDYDIDLPVAASPRVLDYIRGRMYNWSIYTINDKKWRLS